MVAACSTDSVEADSEGDSEGALEGAPAAGAQRAELSRTLKPEQPLPKDTQIGQKIADVLARATKDHVSARVVNKDDEGCRVETFQPKESVTRDQGGYWNHDYTGEVNWKKCSTPEGVTETVFMFTGPTWAQFNSYDDRTGDGLVDGVSEPNYHVTDRNGDGRVDLIEEWGPRLKGFTPVGYDGWTPPTKPTRKLEDTDDSGGLDKETIGATSGSTWWRRR